MNQKQIIAYHKKIRANVQRALTQIMEGDPEVETLPDKPYIVIFHYPFVERGSRELMERATALEFENDSITVAGIRGNLPDRYRNRLAAFLYEFATGQGRKAVRNADNGIASGIEGAMVARRMLPRDKAYLQPGQNPKPGVGVVIDGGEVIQSLARLPVGAIRDALSQKILGIGFTGRAEDDSLIKDELLIELLVEEPELVDVIIGIIKTAYKSHTTDITVDPERSPNGDPLISVRDPALVQSVREDSALLLAVLGAFKNVCLNGEDKASVLADIDDMSHKMVADQVINDFQRQKGGRS